MVLYNNYSSNIKDHKPLITISYTNNKTVWNVRIAKMSHTNMMWASAIGKMVPIDVINTELPQIIKFLKNRIGKAQ